jgi:hypothetical protein
MWHGYCFGKDAHQALAPCAAMNLTRTYTHTRSTRPGHLGHASRSKRSPCPQHPVMSPRHHHSSHSTHAAHAQGIKGTHHTAKGAHARSTPSCPPDTTTPVTGSCAMQVLAALPPWYAHNCNGCCCCCCCWGKRLCCRA